MQYDPSSGNTFWYPIQGYSTKFSEFQTCFVCCRFPCEFNNRQQSWYPITRTSENLTPLICVWKYTKQNSCFTADWKKKYLGWSLQLLLPSELSSEGRHNFLCWIMANRGGAQRPNGTQGKVCQFKLVLLGESAVGKSSLVLRFVKGQFHEFQESTIGGKYAVVWYLLLWHLLWRGTTCIDRAILNLTLNLPKPKKKKQNKNKSNEIITLS